MVLDPKTWILFIMATAGQIPTASVTSFASINIASFGFSTLGTQYMLIPGGAVQLFGMLLGGWVATRWPGTRCAVMVVSNTICIIGSGLLVGLPSENKVRCRNLTDGREIPFVVEPKADTCSGVALLLSGSVISRT